MELVPVARMVNTARIQPAQALPDETHISWPIPVKGDDGLRVAFLFAPRRLTPGAGQALSPPSYLAQIDGQTGRFIDLRWVRPIEFGMTHAEDEVLGNHTLPEGITGQQAAEYEERAWQLMDALLPSFMLDDRALTDPLARAATDLSRVYWTFAAAPLRGYYRAVGKRFFAWLDAVGR